MVPKLRKALQRASVAELADSGSRTDAALLEAAHDAGLEIESAGVLAGDVLEGVEDEEWLEWLGGLARSGDALDRGGRAPRVLRQAMASQWLVEARIRSSEPRGGEVRLDVNIPLRARAMHRVSIDTRRWRWRHVALSILQGAIVVFDRLATDPGADPLEYTWEFGDGESATGIDLTQPSHIYVPNDTYVATLTVRDGDGGEDTDVVQVRINNVAPVVVPGDDEFRANEGEALTISVQTFDPGDDTLFIEWDFRDGDTADGTFKGASSTTGGGEPSESIALARLGRDSPISRASKPAAYPLAFFIFMTSPFSTAPALSARPLTQSTASGGNRTPRLHRPGVSPPQNKATDRSPVA